VPQLVDHLNPEPRLKQSANRRWVGSMRKVPESTNLGETRNGLMYLFMIYLMTLSTAQMM
jgi:hypothetical protein